MQNKYFSRIADNHQSPCWEQITEAKIRAVIKCPAAEELVHKKSLNVNNLNVLHGNRSFLFNVNVFLISFISTEG